MLDDQPYIQQIDYPKQGLQLSTLNVILWPLRCQLMDAGNKAEEKKKKPALSKKYVSARKSWHATNAGLVMTGNE